MKTLLLLILFSLSVFASSDFITQTKEFFDSSLFTFNEKPISIYSLIKAFSYILAGFILGFLYKRWVLRVTKKHENISMMTVRLMSNIGYYVIILIFAMSAFRSVGVDLKSLSLIAGALSIGIGFGLQTVVSNLIAGIIIMFERTIRIGDVIEIDNTLMGTVTDMRIRSTTVKTFDNVDIIVPNSSFIQNNVINLTLEDKIRRLHIPFGVAYGTEIEDVKKAVLEALEQSELHYIKDDEDKKPDIRMVLMNASSVDLELIVWVDRSLKQISLPSDFMILIYNALRANNISIPFPQMDVHMKSE
jgi:small-conductance mechanosensitive channel